MNTTHSRGDTVRSRVSRQGLVEGRTYEVVDVLERRTFVGTFVTYVVRSESGEELSVGNGHLVLEAVS